MALVVFHLNFSIDFKGGSVYQFKAPAATNAQVTHTAVAAGTGSTINVQKEGGTSWTVQTPVLSTKTQFAVQNALAARFHLSPNQVSLKSIGASWGSQISLKAIEALIAFLVVIVLYLSIAFEWRMATAALVALVHDIVITSASTRCCGSRSARRP